MILVFNTQQEAMDCEAQIASKIRILYENYGYSIINNEIEISKGKQRIEKWAQPQQAYNLNKWYFTSPKIKWPNDYDNLIDGYTFEILPTVPENWFAPD